MKCPHCHKEMDPAWVRCPFDGTILEPKGGNPILFWIIGIGLLALVAGLFLAQGGINPFTMWQSTSTPLPTVTKIPTSRPTSRPKPTNTDILALPPTSSVIQVNVTNYGCDPQDFYVDGIKVLSLDPYDGTGYFNTSRGEHIICLADPTNCNDPINVTYDDGSEQTISPGSHCPSSKPSTIDLKVINQACQKQYLFIDGSNQGAIRKVGSAIFSIDYGYHTFQICADSNQQNCGEQWEWSYYYDNTLTIENGDYCQ